MEEEEPVVVAVPVKEEYNIATENPRYGISDQIEAYECDSCCFCARPLLVSAKSQQLRKEWADVLPQYNKPWQEWIDKRIQEQETKPIPSWRVYNLGFRQRIHAACSTVMTQQEYDAMLARGKDHTPIPRDIDDRSVERFPDYQEITRSSGRLPLCDYCDGVLNQNYPGLAYTPRFKERVYLHDKCYDILYDLKKAEKERKEAEKAVGIPEKVPTNEV